jgi:YD repeat-containing protein
MYLKYSVIIIIFVKYTCFNSAWSNMARPDNERFEVASSVKTNLFSGSTSEVEYYNGNLKFNVTDLSLAGNGGLDIVIGRQYNADSLNTGLISTYKLSSDSVSLGPGWKVTGVLRVWHEDVFHFDPDRESFKYYKGAFIQICNNIRGWGGNIYIDLPNGSTERLYRVSNQPQAKTQSNWLLTCQAGQILVYSPNGDQYDLGHIDNDQYKGFSITQGAMPIEPRMDNVWPHNSFTYMNVKKITDRFGNFLNYNYKYHGNKYKLLNVSGNSLEVFNSYLGPQIGDFSHTGGALLIENIKSSDGRELTFNYDTYNGRLTSIEDNLGRKWKYSYKNQKPTTTYPLVEKNLSDLNNSVLTNVEHPNNLNYKYEYYDEAYQLGGTSVNPGGTVITTQTGRFKGGRLSKIINSQGGWVSYDYEHFRYFANNNNNMFAGVRLKEKK